MSGTKNAFVLMPFSPHYDDHYISIFRPALQDLDYQVNRADDLFLPGTLIFQIYSSIQSADLILCEMSDRNPNVFYELGLAHANDKPVILISDNKENLLPFDLRHVRTILYDRNTVDWKQKLKADIQLAANAVETSRDGWRLFPADLINHPYEGFKIISPYSGDTRIGRIAVTGIYDKLPSPEITVMLFITSLDESQIWPQEPVELHPETKTWQGEVALYEKPQHGAYILLGGVGEAGKILCDYYVSVGVQTKLWPPLVKLSPEIKIYHKIRIRKPPESNE